MSDSNPAPTDGISIELPHLPGGIRIVPWSELTFRSDPWGGPGGQHANRSATRVTLIWEPQASMGFSDDEKARIIKHCATRMSTEGFLRIRAAGERSQAQNKKRCVEILHDLVRAALTPPKRRRPTRPTRSSRERRLKEKRQRSQIKSTRRKDPRED